jgi:hypothetical protein
MQLNQFVSLALLCIASTARADPPACEKWDNERDDCELLEKTLVQGTGTCPTTGLEREVALGERYDDEPEGVCEKLIKHLNAFNIANGIAPLPNFNSSTVIKACVFKGGGDKNCYDVRYDVVGFPIDTNVFCTYDSNNANGINADDDSWAASYGTTQPQPHCFCTANGPYASLVRGQDWEVTGSWWYVGMQLSNEYFRHIFPSALKDAILNRNWQDNGSKTTSLGNKIYRTDARYSTTSVLNPTHAKVFDPRSPLYKFNYLARNAAQIDHIIPRKDSKGCLCGPATSNNAAVISLELNQTMSNIPPNWNIDRARMYERYVTCPDPTVAQYQGPSKALFAMPVTLMQPQNDEGTNEIEDERERYPAPPAPRSAAFKADDESGGCSTSHAGGLGIVLAWLLVRRRRPRT